MSNKGVKYVLGFQCVMNVRSIVTNSKASQGPFPLNFYK